MLETDGGLDAEVCRDMDGGLYSDSIAPAGGITVDRSTRDGDVSAILPIPAPEGRVAEPGAVLVLAISS
jgi:hypothetical protein